MSWHTVVVDADHLHVLLSTIRSAGGTITNSCPLPVGYSVTYVTLDG